MSFQFSSSTPPPTPATHTYSPPPNLQWPHIWKDKAPHLGDVNFGTFSSRHNHRLKVVVFRQGFLSRGASLVSSIVENAVHLVLKCLPKSVPWGGLQLIVMSFLNDLGAEEEVQFSVKHQSVLFPFALILTPPLLVNVN